MSNEINPVASSRVSAQVEPPHVGAAAAGVQAKPEIKPVVKPNIQYDPTAIRRNLEEAIKRLNEQLEQNSRKLNFSMDPTTKSLVIVVKNSETGEVVRQIPEESVLRVAHHIESLKGLLLNTQT